MEENDLIRLIKVNLNRVNNVNNINKVNFKIYDVTVWETNTLIFFYKEPVYEQLALGWQITKKLSGLNPLSLSSNKTYRLKKSVVFPL